VRFGGGWPRLLWGRGCGVGRTGGSWGGNDGRGRGAENVRAGSMKRVSRFRSSPELAARPKRTSESKDTSNSIILVPLRIRSSQSDSRQCSANFGFAALARLIGCAAALTLLGALLTATAQAPVQIRPPLQI